MTPLHHFHIHNISQIMPSNTSLYAYGDDNSDSEANFKESLETLLFLAERRIHLSTIGACYSHEVLDELTSRDDEKFESDAI